jgi:hypothetical protein
VLALAAVALPYVRGRSPWWIAGFGCLLAGLMVAPVRGAESLPLAACAVLVCAALAAPQVPWRRLRERAAASPRDPQLDS